MSSRGFNFVAPIDRIFGSRALRWTLLFLILLLFAGIRYRLRAMPLERDEGEYAYAGQLLLQHIPPYVLAYNMKLPGTYVAYAVILSLFGQSATGVHLGLILVNVAAVLLVYGLAVRLFGYLAGLIAAASYALLSTSDAVRGLAGHGTHFAVIPVLMGVLLLLRAEETRHRWLVLLSGLLLGLGYVMKQHAFFFILFGGLYLLWTGWKQGRGAGLLVRELGIFALGSALPFVLTCWWMWRAGVFTSFWFWTFSYAARYITNVPIWMAISYLKRALPGLVLPAPAIWCLAGIGLLFLIGRAARSRTFFLGSFFVFSLLTVCPGFYFRRHYFILALPALSLLVALAICAATEALSGRTKSNLLAAVPLGVFVAAFAISVWHQRVLLFEADPTEAMNLSYSGTPFLAAPQLAAYIRQHTNDGDRIAVLGSEPEIYFYAHRHAATGYIYTYPLMEPQEYARSMQREMIGEIEAERPAMLVFVNAYDSWIPQPGHERLIFKWIDRYIGEQYIQVGTVDLTVPPAYRWGEAAAAPSHAKSQWTLDVYQRNRN